MEPIQFNTAVNNFFKYGERDDSTQEKSEALFQDSSDWSTQAADAIGIAFTNMDEFLSVFQNSEKEN